MKQSGIATRPYGGGQPAQDELLAVGAGAESLLAPHADAIAEWLKSGGRALALGLNTQQANDGLSVKMKTMDAEHIAAYFPPPAADSPLAGISPADIHCAAPAEIPLLSANNNVRDMAVIGNGVLGWSSSSGIVFCQLPVENFDSRWGHSPAPQHNRKRTYRRNSFLLARLLANLGVASETPLLEWFSKPLGSDVHVSLLKNGNFATDADVDGTADYWLFSSNLTESVCHHERFEGAGDSCVQVLHSPVSSGEEESTTMLAQHGVPIKEGQWYRISLRARAEQLANNTITVTVTNTSTWRSFFDYQRFQPGAEWQSFNFEVQASATEHDQTRFQIWYAGSGRLWLSDIQFFPITDPTKGRWLEGLYLDQPEEWDDPYRFFRW